MTWDLAWSSAALFGPVQELTINDSSGIDRFRQADVLAALGGNWANAPVAVVVKASKPRATR